MQVFEGRAFQAENVKSKGPEHAWHDQGSLTGWFPCFAWPCSVTHDTWSGHLGTLQCDAFPSGIESVACKAVSHVPCLG